MQGTLSHLSEASRLQGFAVLKTIVDHWCLILYCASGHCECLSPRIAYVIHELGKKLQVASLHQRAIAHTWSRNLFTDLMVVSDIWLNWP